MDEGDDAAARASTSRPAGDNAAARVSASRPADEPAQDESRASPKRLRSIVFGIARWVPPPNTP